MRIISGKYKGRHIQPPKNITARPTTDFAKESLFNLLNNRMELEGISVLDLFAGTGSIGIECISRGAKDVISIEMAHTQANFIHRTCELFKIDNLTLIRSDVFKYIASCHIHFDLIFADPPYNLVTLESIPNLIFEHNLLKEDGLFVLEHSSKQNFKEHAHFLEHREYGSVNFSFFG